MNCDYLSLLHWTELIGFADYEEDHGPVERRVAQSEVNSRLQYATNLSYSVRAIPVGRCRMCDTYIGALVHVCSPQLRTALSIPPATSRELPCEWWVACSPPCSSWQISSLPRKLLVSLLTSVCISPYQELCWRPPTWTPNDDDHDGPLPSKRPSLFILQNCEKLKAVLQLCVFNTYDPSILFHLPFSDNDTYTHTHTYRYTTKGARGFYLEEKKKKKKKWLKESFVIGTKSPIRKRSLFDLVQGV